MRNRVFVKVQDGCDNFCSYCIVPHLRGRARSRNTDDIICEINALPEYVKEVVLTGIDLSSFENLGELCKKVDGCGRAFRLSSIEVRIITREFLDILKGCKNFCQSFHIPLQSGSDSVLKAMNRKYTTAEYFEKVCLVRSVFPEAQVTTDIICGFPTETEVDFTQTADFVRKVGFLHAHIFPYSRRTGTPAATLPQLSSSVITQRTKKLIAIQDEISSIIKAGYLNKTVNVLFEHEKNGWTYGTSREYLSIKAKGSFPLDWHIITVIKDSIK